MHTAAANRASPALENPVYKAVFSKIDWRIIPLLLIAYMVAYLDRINIGYAQLQMKQTLPFDDAVYGLGAGIFFVGYFLFAPEVPQQYLLLERIQALRKTLLRIMVLWGVAACAMMFVSTRALPEFYVVRFLLSAFEAGLRFPGSGHSVFHLLVPVGAARAGDCDIHVRDHNRVRYCRTAVRVYPEVFRRLQRSSRLAMAVPRARGAGRRPRRPCVYLSA